MSIPKFDRIYISSLKAGTNNEYVNNFKYVWNNNRPYLLLITERN